MTDYDHFKSVVKHIVVKNKYKYQIKYKLILLWLTLQEVNRMTKIIHMSIFIHLVMPILHISIINQLL